MPTATRYEQLHDEAVQLKTRQLLSTILPSLAVAFVSIYLVISKNILLALLVGICTFILSLQIFHHLWVRIFSRYKQWDDRKRILEAEIEQLTAKVSKIFAVYPQRCKGEQFKKAYNLAGLSINKLEEALAVGMHREGREVFVTAFIRHGVAVRVTASIGSLYRCAPADNPRGWSSYILCLCCDEIRQYHNHPAYNGKTRPSSADHTASKQIAAILGKYERNLRSFIIFWNPIREWKIIEYNKSGSYWIHTQFDIGTHVDLVFEDGLPSYLLDDDALFR